MSISLLSIARLNNSRSYSLNNQPCKKETRTKLVLTKALTMVTAYGKQSLQHLVNIVQKKRMVAIGTGTNDTNNGLQHTIQKIAKCNMILQQIIPKAPNFPTKYH